MRLIKGYLFVALLLMYFTQISHAQTISQSVISGVGSIENQLSYTLGETVIVTGRTKNLTLLQGFHQPYKALVTSLVDKGVQNQVTLFPNPTNGEVIIRMEKTSQFALQVELVNLNGKRLGPKRVWEVSESTEMSVDLGAFPDGTYLLVLRQTDGRLLHEFKVSKAH